MSEHASRKFAYHWRGHIPKLSKIVGEVTLAMNLLQSTLGGLFWSLMQTDIPPLDDGTIEELDKWASIRLAPEIVFAAWNVIASDAAQRDMMLAAAQAKYPANSKMLGRIAWIKLKADSLGRIRNDAAHLVIDFQFNDNMEGGRLAPHPFAMPEKRIRRLSEAKTLENRFRYVAGDIIALQTYALAVLYKTANPEATLPKRPKLRSVPNQG